MAPSATATFTRGSASLYSGRLEILHARAWPQPGPRWLGLEMEGPADAVELRLYSAGMTCVGRADLGPVSAGWNHLELAPALDGLPAGLYYFRVEAEQGGRHSDPQRGRLMLLR